MIDDSNEEKHWRIDRRVPVAFLLAIVIQTGGALWWAATVTATLASAKDIRDRLEVRLEKVEAAREDLSTRLTRIEEQISGSQQVLNEILREVRRSPQPPVRR